MRLNKHIIFIAIIMSIPSLLFYLCESSAIIFSSNKMNEILMAVFGAGVSSLCVGMIEYCYTKNEFEDKILNLAERVISAVADLKEYPIETVGNITDANNISGLIQDYLDEESSKLINSNSARNTLICLIESCKENECELYACDEESASSRYFLRVKNNLKSVAESYYYCFVNFDKYYHDIMNEISHSSYLLSFCKKIPLLNRINDARKTNNLKLFCDNLTQIKEKLEDAFGVSRLFKNNSTSYYEMFTVFKRTQDEWISMGNTAEDEKNLFVMMLVKPISSFASMTKADSKHEYEEEWWRLI